VVGGVAAFFVVSTSAPRRVESTRIARAVAPATRGTETPIEAEDPSRVVPVSLADKLPPRLPAEGVPAGWDLREFAGRAIVELVRDGNRLGLRLRSERASFALSHDVVVDLDDTPVLTWAWKAVRLPEAADVRDPARDDQVAQVYVVFPRWPSPRTQSEVIGYVWDSQAPVGTRLTSPRAENVRLIVVESGSANAGAWRVQNRNVAEDYAALFRGKAPRVGLVAVMIDSNDTGSEAEAVIADLLFTKTTP
jgi:Protein of unknown function (DUF3047)